MIAAGATQLNATAFEENEWRWHVLADPDGNEFCILQPPDDFPRAAGRANVVRD